MWHMSRFVNDVHIMKDLGYNNVFEKKTVKIKTSFIVKRKISKDELAKYVIISYSSVLVVWLISVCYHSFLFLKL